MMILKNGRTITSNQFWGGINRRFDARVARLYRLGYRLEGNDFGSFKVRRDYLGIRVVPMSIIQRMPNWEYRLFLYGTLAPSGARRIARVA